MGGQWQNLGQPAFDRYVESRYSQAADVLGSKGASVVLMTTPYYDSGVAPVGGAWPEDDPARVWTDNAAMRQAAAAAPGGSGGGKVYVFDLNAVVSPDQQVHGDGRSGERALWGRGALHTLGRHLRRLEVGPRARGARTGPRRGFAGWRLAGHSATIDPDMVPEPALPVVRRATHEDVDAMAAQLAETFFDDPVIGHIFRNPPRRDAGLRAYFRTQMRADYLPFGGCYTTDGYAGSAIWAPAGKPLLTGITAIVTMLPVLPYVAANLVTTLRLLNLVESMHPHEPHWYLATLGTAVAQQGKGVGGALMRPVLEHCDREGIPCYLESSKERNVPFYRRHGFEVVREVPLPGDGPPIWTMWREPQPAPSS